MHIGTQGQSNSVAYKQKSLQVDFIQYKKPTKLLYLSSGMGLIDFFMPTWVLLGFGEGLYMYVLDVWWSQISHDCHCSVCICPYTTKLGICICWIDWVSTCIDLFMELSCLWVRWAFELTLTRVLILWNFLLIDWFLSGFFCSLNWHSKTWAS